MTKIKHSAGFQQRLVNLENENRHGNVMERDKLANILGIYLLVMEF